MPYITLDVEPDGKINAVDMDASVEPLATLSVGTQIITATLLAMIETGMPKTAVHNLGGDICALIGRTLDQHKGN